MRPHLLLLLLLITSAACTQDAAKPTLSQASRLRAQGQTAEAVKAYETILQQAADDNERASALLGLAAVYLSDSREKATECYRRVVALPQAKATAKQSAWRQLAMLARRAEDPEAAREAYRHLLADFPGDSENAVAATLEWSAFESREGEPQQALESLRKLLKTADKSPRLPDIYLALIGAEAAGGDLKAADKTAREASRRFPERREFMVALAGAYEAAGNEAGAAAIVQELLLRKPQEHDLFRSLYDLSKAQQRLPQLVSWLEKQAAAQPQETAWLEHLARLHEWENDSAAALAAYERLVARRATDVRVLQDAGQAALRAKAYDKAARWLEQALALEPDNQTLLVLTGEVQLQQGRKEEALALWKRGLHYDLRNRQSVQALGSILGRYDLNEEAAKLYAEARAAGDDPRAFAVNLGQIYENLGQTGAAVREYSLLLQPGSRESGAASLRLNRLAEDDALRPELIAALQPLQDQKLLSTDGTAVLVYARVLSGADPAEALGSLDGSSTRGLGPLLSRIASRLETTGREETAIKCYERLLREPLTGDYAAGVAMHLAELRGDRGDWRGALTTLATVRSEGVQPELAAQVALARGELLLRRARRPAEALGMFNAAIELQPQGPLALKAHWGEADVAFSLGRYELALQAYRSLVRQSDPTAVIEEPVPGEAAGFQRLRRRLLPGPDYVSYQEAEALFREGKQAEAGAAFRKFAAGNASSPYANDALERVVLLQCLGQAGPDGATYLQALLHFERGETPEAARLLEGLRRSPLADAALLLLGQVRLWENDTPAALVVLDELADGHADSPLAPEGRYLAAMALALSDPAACQKRLEALLERYPEAPQAEQAKVILENWRRAAGR